MDLSTIANWKELGVGISAMLILGFILYFFIKSHNTELTESRVERQIAAKALMDYVESNNHQKTEMVEEHTKAMVQVGYAIESHTKVIEKLSDKLN